MSRVTAILIAVLIASLFGLTYYHYRVQSLNRDVAELSNVAKQQQATLDQIETQRQAVAAIDIKYTKELADAKSENERLRADIANGTKRLQLNATCSKPVSKTTGPASVPDDASARLTNAAERDYLSLRERIGITTSQINGLQAYITNVCLK
ncbi:lysis protein [Yersinia enterocolitica]|uniref:lysis protein n=1 Tax=Yersinia enterocolitica TaxID=630 RepID=UPI0022FF2826|nr:lysis protein [Yersinia enterocolitica]EKN6049664.1 lysis protein [Yersinia enterocolitica]MDA5531724.1 lysis protein [Yersinia enterocolitica]HDL8515379.1 lysis protein [Yersinia enterocolitica]HDL8557635.1 lysis protein [Yersinia enterocolitica]HEI6705640.1 lysis protein [Yersinia enterocolitica]